MKKYIQFSYLISIGLFCAIYGCSPQSDVITDIHKTDVSKICRVEIKPSHLMLIADGKATMNLTPIVYIKEGDNEVRLPDSRIKDEWFQYTSSHSTLNIGRKFSTSDASLIGKTINVKVSVMGTNLQSDEATFTIIKGVETEAYNEIVFPVVFHVLRENREEEITGLTYDKELFYNILQKMNNTFSGVNSKNPVGVDTRIRFKPAIYAPTGEKLMEPGINRVTINKLEDPEGDVVRNNLIWSPEQYLNIWLVSTLRDNSPSFLFRFLWRCQPAYKYPHATNVPQGIELSDYSGNEPYSIYNAGIMYKLQDVGIIYHTYSTYYGYVPGVNELVHYVGYYLGLLQNNIFQKPMPGEDYCDDTIGYYSSKEFYLKNETSYKETPECFFLSENIMDDPTGFHNSISAEQNKRMRWFIENCPERSAWKSTFAFTGK